MAKMRYGCLVHNKVPLTNQYWVHVIRILVHSLECLPNFYPCCNLSCRKSPDIAYEILSMRFKCANSRYLLNV